MSINVTVNKKPISLTTTGIRMVAQDDNAEFNLRRKIRLQQVRQQSKEIAANIRDRVKQEKTKQLQNIEHRAEKDLKKNQDKKLQTLQKYYDECNREIGAAHKNAAMEKDPAQILNELSKKNDKGARDRLKVAIENKAKEEMQQKNKLELLEKQRKYSKDIEKARSNLVVGIKKHQRSPPPKKRKKKTSKLNDTFNSDIENSSPTKPRKKSPVKVLKRPVKTSKSPIKQKKIIFNEEIHEVDCNDTCNPQFSEITSKIDINNEEPTKHSKTDIPEEPRKHLKIDVTSACNELKENPEIYVEYPEKDSPCAESSGRSKSSQTISGRPISLCDNETCPVLSPIPHERAFLCPAAPPTSTECICHSQFSSASTLTKDEIRKLIEDHRPIDNCRSMDYNKCTKISDRIRQRSEQLMQNINLETVTIAPELCTNLCGRKKFEMKNIPIVDIPGASDSKLPYVPQTTLRSKLTRCHIPPQTQTTKAKYYNQKTPYTKVCVPPPTVHKLDKSCVEVDTSIESKENADFVKNMQDQDERAKIRGEKALKRAQVQNDYKQLMKELPVLQRQERLAGMRSHNPEFHLTDERLNELERRRQNRIENIFEKYYHKSKALETPMITIRPVQKEPPTEDMKLPFTALDVSEELQGFNFGQWKSENPSQISKSVSYRKTGSSSEPHTEHKQQRAEVEDEECRQKCLAELLHRLNKQRDLLLQEVQNLPSSSNLKKILQDDTLMHLTDDSTTSSTKPQFVSVSTSPPESKKTKGVKKRQGTATTSDSAEEKQKKRPKPKEKKPKVTKVIKNDEGTQTSPNIFKKTSPVKEKPATKSKKVTQEQQTQPDDVSVPDEDNLCEIIIKMCDESKVKICTQPIGSSSVNYEEKVLHLQKPVNCDISSSTSYLSPPMPIICPTYANQPDANIKYNTEYKDTLYGKPKQTNLDTFPTREHKDDRTDHIKKHSITKQKNVKSHTPTKIINPQLLNYIKKLLSMSRKSIDDLTVSSISEVSSPSPQLIECQQNNPFIQLQNVMNYYDLTFADIQNQLSNSSATTPSEQNADASNTNAQMDKLENEEDSAPTSDDIDYSEILSKYQEVTRTCVDKISTLTLMIDKIRAEKEKIFSPTSVDFNENSLTSYLELPQQKCEKNSSPIQEGSKNCTSTSNGSNKSYSLTQEEIDRYFLEIGPSKKDRDQTDYNRGDTKETFVPMLKGIPKYSNDPIVNQINLIPKTRPPASLKHNVQRYNLNIDMTPHELSTIAEMDTACNSKNFSEQRPKSPEDQIPSRDSESTSNSGFITISPEYDNNTSPTKKERRKTPRSKNTKSSELSGMQLLSSISDNTSSSSPENFENILRTMGLGWAISTLKKTQEALALSSSSSSDSSLRKHVSLNNTSVSDVTLKDVLNREFLKKLSSSSSSDSPTLQELQDISDIIGATQSKDRSTTQRTSTPVQQSKSTDSKKDLFASVSDISSVRQQSDENMFLSIPDISLDTNRSLK